MPSRSIAGSCAELEVVTARKLADEGNAARLDQVQSVLHSIASDCPETCE